MSGNVVRQDAAPWRRRCRWSSPDGHAAPNQCVDPASSWAGRCALPGKIALRLAHCERQKSELSTYAAMHRIRPSRLSAGLHQGTVTLPATSGTRDNRAPARLIEPPCGTPLARQRLAELARLSTARLLCVAALTRGRPGRRHLQRVSPVLACAVRRGPVDLTVFPARSR